MDNYGNLPEHQVHLVAQNLKYTNRREHNRRCPANTIETVATKEGVKITRTVKCLLKIYCMRRKCNSHRNQRQNVAKLFINIEQ